jgi:hypothetical protein
MLRSIAVAGAALLLGTTVACGGSADQAGSDASTRQYCDALKSAQQEFSAIDSGDVTPANLNRILDRIHSLADQAPAQVADDWQKLDGAISQLQSGLGDLGLSFEDLSDPSKLSQVDPQKLQEFGQKMQQLGGRQFDRAGNAIEQHARQVCHLNLGKG